MSEHISGKEKLIHEVKEYFIHFAYLAIFLGIFPTYSRLLMAEHDISYGDYGISIIKALILAKVVMLGDMLKLGRWLKDRPLMYHTLFKTVVFTAWVLLFHLFELTGSSLLHGRGITGGVSEFIGQLPYELPAHLLIIFFAFLPFFAMKELGAIMGKGKLHQLFFSGKSTGTALETNVRRTNG
jgi:hypothetical protein